MGEREMAEGCSGVCISPRPPKECCARAVVVEVETVVLAGSGVTKVSC